MRANEDTEVAVAAAIAPLFTFAVAAALVGVRGEVRPEITAVALAVTVALGARFGGRGGGVGSALMAAVSFDFMHTRPYLSLKIANSDDLLLTILLLVVGLIVGGLAGTAAEDRRRARARNTPLHLTRVLSQARDAEPDDIQLAVKAELLGLLGLRDCWFTPDSVSLPVLGSRGELDVPIKRFARGGFELPDEGVAVLVAAYGHRFGYLVCQTTRGVGVSAEARDTAAALGEVLGLAMSVPPSG